MGARAGAACASATAGAKIATALREAVSMESHWSHKELQQEQYGVGLQELQSSTLQHVELQQDVLFACCAGKSCNKIH